jgi:hypothetical protein
MPEGVGKGRSDLFWARWRALASSPAYPELVARPGFSFANRSLPPGPSGEARKAEVVAAVKGERRAAGAARQRRKILSASARSGVAQRRTSKHRPRPCRHANSQIG